jgi:rhamnose transport system ATP-binding protein
MFVSQGNMPYLSLVGASKAFGGITVLKGVDFDVRPGEVHALMGENGAGKSTLIKIISGLYTPDSGTISVMGKEVRHTSPRDAARLGIATVYQELLLFPELTVAENVFLGHYPKTGWGGIDWATVRNRTRQLLDSLDSQDMDVDTKVLSLSVAQRQRVEIAKALSQDARVIIMDEPTASLVDADVRRLISVIEQLKARGVGIIYVSHRLPEVFALADRVTVLRDGALIATKPIAEVTEASLVAMMVGRSIDQLFPKAEPLIGETILEVKNLSYGKLVKDISFSLKKGEILGIGGLVGSGRTELALTLFGITPAASGSILIEGKKASIQSPRQARDLGIAYVPEDRGSQGLVKSMSIQQNISMASLDKLTSGIFIRFAKEAARATEAFNRLGVRARGGIKQQAGKLSGGNQQKVVIAKWLETNPRILILDEPTRGIDVGAKAEIHTMMGELARSGMAIIMISSELPEVLGMSDRVMIMNNGRAVTILDRKDASLEAVGLAMTDGHAVAGVA